MAQLTRRSFVTAAAAGVTAPGFLAAGIPTASAQLVWTASDWKLTAFHKLLNHQARIKQMYDIVQIGEGRFLNNIKNSLNGLHFGFGVPAEEIKIVAALHGPANMLNYDDYVWKKYRIGEWLEITDPSTGANAERNIFYTSANTFDSKSAANDPNDEHSLFQAKTIQELQTRGVQFLSCHTAAEEQARLLAHQHKLSESPEEIVRDMLVHIVPGVLVVASMVAAIAMLQAEGHYTYITV